jgi:hypothetical protein
VASEAEHGHRDERVRGFEAERDAGDQPDTPVGSSFVAWGGRPGRDTANDTSTFAAGRRLIVTTSSATNRRPM